MPFIGNKPSAVPLTSADIADGIITSAKIVDATIANADIANSTIDLTAKVTGTLPTTKGGTGLAALGTVGQALVVNSGATALEFATVGATAGQVIQVVTATDQTQRSTISTSFVTGSNTLSVSITPSSASNKIFVIVTSCAIGDPSASAGIYTIYRGATNLGNGNSGMSKSGDAQQASLAMSYLDSPSTTSSTTYQVYFRSEVLATAFLNVGSIKASITCLEIKG
jgi:hypothetical protein